MLYGIARGSCNANCTVVEWASGSISSPPDPQRPVDIPIPRCPNGRRLPGRWRQMREGRSVAHGAAAILVLALCGCAAAQNGRNQLEEANDAFSKAIRWSDLRGLGRRVVPDRQAEFLKLLPPGEDSLKVTDYELEDVQDGSDKAVVR